MVALGGGLAAWAFLRPSPMPVTMPCALPEYRHLATNEAAVALVLYCVINEQKGLGGIAEQGRNQLAQLISGQRAHAQKPVHLVVAHIGQMGRQMRANVVGGRTEPVPDVGNLGQYERTFLPELLQSA